MRQTVLLCGIIVTLFLGGCTTQPKSPCQTKSLSYEEMNATPTHPMDHFKGYDK